MTADADTSIIAAIAPPAANSVAAQWVRYQAMSAEMDRRALNDDDPSEEEMDVLRVVQKFVFLGPIQTKADALAKLSAAIRSFRISTRTDGTDLGALALVAAWIEGRP